MKWMLETRLRCFRTITLGLQAFTSNTFIACEMFSGVATKERRFLLSTHVS